MGNMSKILQMILLATFLLCMILPAKVSATDPVDTDPLSTATIPTATTNYVLLLDQGTAIEQTGGNIEELAALLSGDLLQYNIAVQVKTISKDQILSDTMQNNLDSSNENKSPLAIIWIEQPMPEQPTAKESRNQPQNIKVTVHFPSENSIYIRELPASTADSMGSVPLAAIITGMIRITSQIKQPKPAQIEIQSPKKLENSPLSKDNNTETLRRKFGLEAMAAYAFYPISNSNLFGISTSISYFPVAPLAVRFGFSYMRDISPGKDRYNGFYAEWPLSIGGKYCFFHENHEFDIDLSMLATITSFSYQDQEKNLDRQYSKNVNVGINAGTSYYYYPVKYFGLGLNMAIHLSSKSQRYWQSDKLIYSNGNFSIRLMAGFIFDFLR